MDEFSRSRMRCPIDLEFCSANLFIKGKLNFGRFDNFYISSGAMKLLFYCDMFFFFRKYFLERVTFGECTLWFSRLKKHTQCRHIDTGRKIGHFST